MIREEIAQLTEKSDPKLGPISQKFMDTGELWLDPKTGEYVGKAHDGTEVLMGTRGAEKNLERYLKAHPTPKHW